MPKRTLPAMPEDAPAACEHDHGALSPWVQHDSAHFHTHIMERSLFHCAFASPRPPKLTLFARAVACCAVELLYNQGSCEKIFILTFHVSFYEKFHKREFSPRTFHFSFHPSTTVLGSALMQRGAIKGGSWQFSPAGALFTPAKSPSGNVEGRGAGL